MTRLLSLLTEAIDRLPGSADVNYHLGLTHYMLGHEQMARPLLEQALNSGMLALAESYISTVLTLPTSTVGGFLTFFGLAIPLSGWGLVHLTRTPVGRENHAS